MIILYSYSRLILLVGSKFAKGTEGDKASGGGNKEPVKEPPKPVAQSPKVAPKPSRAGSVSKQPSIPSAMVDTPAPPPPPPPAPAGLISIYESIRI